VFITYNETTIKLVVGDKQCFKNQTAVSLDAAPYVKGGRAMVPIRFIAESFNCQVDYTTALVNIKTTPLMINGMQVAKMIRTSRTPEYYYISELKANLFIKGIYQTVFKNHGQQVEEPEHFGEFYNPDVLVYYYSADNTFYLLDVNDNEIGQFIVYEAGGNGLPHPEGTPEYLLFDATAEKWYTLQEEAYALMERWDRTATQYGAAGYDTAWQLSKQYDVLKDSFI